MGRSFVTTGRMVIGPSAISETKKKKNTQYNRGLLPDIIFCWPKDIQYYYYAWWGTILPLLLLFLCPSPWHHTVDQMLCPSPLQYTVDPRLLPSRNLGKNAMEMFRGLLPDDIILLTQCYPIPVVSRIVLMSIIVLSNHTRIGAWVTRKM